MGPLSPPCRGSACVNPGNRVSPSPDKAITFAIAFAVNPMMNARKTVVIADGSVCPRTMSCGYGLIVPGKIVMGNSVEYNPNTHLMETVAFSAGVRLANMLYNHDSKPGVLITDSSKLWAVLLGKDCTEDDFLLKSRIDLEQVDLLVSRGGTVLYIKSSDMKGGMLKNYNLAHKAANLGRSNGSFQLIGAQFQEWLIRAPRG